MTRRWPWDLLGVSWLMMTALASLLPALLHGVHLGPFDILSQSGLSKQAGIVVHNRVTEDQIDEMVPWTTLAWTQVHHGHLPLWNPYSGLGMPLAFNWQSAPFGLPALLGYLVPVEFAYTVGVVATVIIAGTGAYLLGRVLRLSVLACTMAGTVYELSGPMAGWLGWPVAAVMSWGGWLLAATVLIARGRHRARGIVFFAVVFALAIYAGNPLVVGMLVLAVLVFAIALLALRSRLAGSEGILRPLMDLLIAAVAGGALAAPLVLPGLQLASGSTHSSSGIFEEGSAHGLIHLIFQGFDGLPVAGSQWFGSSHPFDYLSSSADVGVIAVVLAVTAVAVYGRRPGVLATTALAVVMATLGLLLPFVPSLRQLPFVGTVQWSLALFPMALAIAVLAGVGLDALIRPSGKQGVRRLAAAGFALAALVILGLYIFGRGHLPPMQGSIRARSFLWPAAGVMLGFAVLLAAAVTDRRGHRNVMPDNRFPAAMGLWAGLVLLAGETAFLVAAGAPLWSSSSQYLAPTPAEGTLQRFVGSSVVGFGAGTCLSAFGPVLGILPEVNVAYGVRELAIYDPMVPQEYFKSWSAATGLPGGVPSLALFCPAVSTADAARRFGVAYVLEPLNTSGPAGSIFVATAGDEELYRIPGAAPATIVPAPTALPLPPDAAVGTPVTVHRLDPAVWSIVTDVTTPQVLRLRITDVPGWHATLDGQPLALQRFSGVMLQARIPPGRHTIEIHYWPTTFTAGLVIAACSAIGLSAAIAIGGIRRRRNKPAP